MEALLDAPLAALVWYVGLLDRVPDFGRAMLAGGLLVALLAVSRRKVPGRNVQFSMSFWKVSLIVLVAVPLVVWLLPATRITVFVERLEPAAPSVGFVWLAALGIWAGGLLAGLAGLLRHYVRSVRALLRHATVPEGDKLEIRLRHWQRRLGASKRLRLVLADDSQPSHLAGVPRVVLPRAAAHWPTATADLLIIQALCRHLKHQGIWHLFAQGVACCYWPVPWVRHIGRGLLHDFQVAADNLAAACYQDEPGYHRALRQLEQRLSTPSIDGGPPRDREPAARRRPGAAFADYVAEVRATLRPQPAMRWDAGALAAAYEQRREAEWSEPGEKLALLIGQSLLLALLVSSVTLREVPPEIERDYSITLDPTWMNTAFPDPGRFAPQPATSPPRDAAGEDSAREDAAEP